MTAIAAVVDPTTTGAGDELDHIFCCCTPLKGLCGADLDPNNVLPDGEEQDRPCVVCADLEDPPCPRCGVDLGPCVCGGCR